MTQGRMRLWSPKDVMAERLHKRVVRTPSGCAICFTAAEAASLGLEAEDVVDLEVHPARPEMEWQRIARHAPVRH